MKEGSIPAELRRLRKRVSLAASKCIGAESSGPGV